MTIYIVTFITSYFLCLFAENLLNRNNDKKTAIFLLCISVLVVAVMAGLRDNSVGTDTISYTAYYVEKVSRFKSIRAFMINYHMYEPGFNVFSYIIGIIFNSSHWFLFWCAIVIYGFSMRTFYFYRNNCSISMAWLFFLTVNCSEALNITRNYMALAIAAYAFTFVFRNNKKKFIIWSIIAMSFHVSAAINFLLFLVYVGLKKYNNWKYKTFIIAGAVVCAFLYSYIFQILSSFSFIASKSRDYLSYSGFSLQINPIIIRIPFLIMILLHRHSFKKANIINDNGTYDSKDMFGEFCFILIFIELILSQLRSFSEVLYRLVTYEAILKYVSYSMVIDMSSYRGNIVVKRVFSYIFMFIVLIYWVVILNSGTIYPYTSDILGIRG